MEFGGTGKQLSKPKQKPCCLVSFCALPELQIVCVHKLMLAQLKVLKTLTWAVYMDGFYSMKIISRRFQKPKRK